MKAERQEKFIRNLENHNNCCQTVANTFCEEYGISVEQMSCLTAGFGGGMTLGEKCGAVTAMFLIAGLDYGFFDGADEEKKAGIKARIARLNSRFLEEFGCSDCNTLKANIDAGKYDLSPVQSRGLRPCVLFMEKACDILEEELGIW